MRVLMIEDDARYCALIRHHLTCRWPDAQLVVSSPVSHPIPAPEYVAQGFDAVLVAYDWPGGRGIDWVKDFVARPRFAPVIFLSEQNDDAEAREAVVCRRSRRRSARRRSITTDCSMRSRAAFGRQMQARADWRTSSEAKEQQRFGEAFIRGYRRIRRLAAGPVSELYLAESEQAGTLVVLKIARDQQTQNELDSSFRRFLQEYEIVQRIRHPGVVRLYDLGVSDQHAYLVMEYFRAGDLRRRMRSELTPADALKIALEIARGLSGIHRGRRAASGPEAGQRDAAGRRLARAHRLRPREGFDAGDGSDRPWPDLRHAPLHEPGAGARRAHRRAQRSLQPGRDAVRDARAREAVRVGESDGDHLQASQVADPGIAGSGGGVSAAGVEAAWARRRTSVSRTRPLLSKPSATAAREHLSVEWAA